VTALQVAKAECANCDGAGNCSGVGIADDLSCYMFRQPWKCYLAEQPIKQCAYFEQCVAPAANARLRNAATAEQRTRAKSFGDGVREYEMAVMPVPTVKYAKCKSCHRRVHAPKRLCGHCARNRTLTAKRQWWSRTRKNGALEPLITKDL
jgi:hypothetical protein